MIGAGLAGLRCAADLTAAGRDVVVVEARDRVGGRVWSHRFTGGQSAERGAEFIDAAHTEVLALAKQLGLRLNAVRSGRDDDARMVDVASRSTQFSMHHSLGRDLAAWQDALDGLARQVDPVDPTAGASAAALDGSALSVLLDSLDLGPMARVVIGRDVRTEYMVAPSQVSQLMAAWMTALHRRSGADVEAHRIVGGNDQLATGLAQMIGGRIRLRAPVASLDAADAAVTLRSGERMIADHLVVTVPLPVLGRLWAGIPRSLSSVGYGIGAKILIQVARRIWLDQGSDGSVRSERAWGEVWETTDDQPGDAGVLTVLLSSQDGAALASLPEAVDRVIGELDRVFPGIRGLAGERVLTDWTNDPCSLGSYATFGPGQLLAAWPDLRRRHGRLLLAGEHTDAWAGYMEGALRSGARAARAIIGDQT